MIKVSVMYPNKDGARFDHDYYKNKHMPLVKARMGDSLQVLHHRQGPCRRRPGRARDLCRHVSYFRQLRRSVPEELSDRTPRRSWATFPITPTSLRSCRSAKSLWRNEAHLPPCSARPRARHSGGRGAGPGLSNSADQDRRAVSGRRLQRHHRPHRRPEARRGDRPERDRREPRRRRRQYRRRGGSELGSRRLYAAAHRAAAADDQRGALQVAEVRCGNGLRAGCADCDGADRACGASLARREQCRRTDRACQSQTRHHQFRFIRQRLDQPSGRRTA